MFSAGRLIWSLQFIHQLCVFVSPWGGVGTIDRDSLPRLCQHVQQEKNSIWFPRWRRACDGLEGWPFWAGVHICGEEMIQHLGLLVSTDSTPGAELSDSFHSLKRNVFSGVVSSVLSSMCVAVWDVYIKVVQIIYHFESVKICFIYLLIGACNRR